MNKKFFKAIAAAMLSAAMAITSVPVGLLEARAALLQDEQPKVHELRYNRDVAGLDYGSSENTTFKFGLEQLSTNGDVGAVAGKTFRIAAVKKDSDRSDDKRGYVGTEVKTNYGDTWWHSRFAFGPANEVTPNVVYNGAKPTSASDVSASVLQNYHPLHNGAVTTVSGKAKDGSNVTLEVRQRISTSADDDLILVEYTVFNTSDKGVEFWIGNETDTMMHQSDDCPIMKTQSGFTMIASHGNEGQGSSGDPAKYQFSDFRLFSKNPTGKNWGLGMEKRDSSDPSDTRSWIGEWSTTVGKRHEMFTFEDSPLAYANVGDSAAAFSAYFELKSHETKKATFAIRMRTSVYYVNPSYTGSSNGYITRPFKTIEDAVAAMGANGVEKGYVVLSNDVTMKDPVTIPANLDLTIATAEYETPSQDPPNGTKTYIHNGVNEYSGGPKKITRGIELAGQPMFTMANGTSKLTIADVIVDGNNVASTAPMIKATAGEVRTRAGAQLINAKNSTIKQGSAIDISGTAKVDLRNVEVTGNESSTNEGSAVRVANSVAGTAEQTVTLGGKVVVQNNTLADGQNGNLLLVDKNMIGVGGDFPLNNAAKIGLATTAAPTSATTGTPVVSYDHAKITITPFSGANFTSDKNGNTINTGVVAVAYNTTHPYKIPGTSSGVSTQHGSDLYVNANFYSLNIFYVDEFNNPINNSANNVSRPSVAASSTIDQVLPSVAGKAYDKDGTKTYTTNGVLTEDPVTGELTQDTIKIEPNGKVSGTMPERNVSLTIKYRLSGVQYYFSPMNGGAILERNENVSGGSSTLGTLPVVTRQNYNFDGWFEFTDTNGNHKFDDGVETIGTTQLTAFLPPTAANEGPHHYVAKWSPDGTPYQLAKKYKNISANPAITFLTRNTTEPFNSAIHVTGDTIPGYVLQSAIKQPTNTPTLNFNTTTGETTGTMPAMNVGVTFNFRVDNSAGAKKTLKIKHVDANGTNLAAEETRLLSAEAPIDLDKKTIGGYSYNTVAVTQGGTEDPINFILGFSQTSTMGQPLLTLLDTANGKVKGYMPNQDVEITFTYGPSTTPGVTRRFVDVDNPTRPLYGDFNQLASSSAVNIPFPAGVPQLYGYVFGTATSSVGSVTIDGSGNLGGTMPASGGVNVDFRLNKDATKWQLVHFATTTDSQATATFSHNPTPNPVLLDDGITPGHENAPKFSTLVADGTIPTVTPARYYMLEGWYADAAGTQRIGDNDTLSTPTSGNKTIYAKIVEDPSMWFDITFNSGTNGSIAPTPVSAHVHDDQLWSTLIQSTVVVNGDLPVATPVANYNFLGWYHGATKMEPSSVIQRGVYTATFGKDAPTWGLNTGAFTPTGRIGMDGSGEVNVNGVRPGNVYVLVDPDGVVVGVATADPNGNNINFPDQVPGRTYTVVEGEPGTTATVGQPQSAIVGVNLSTPKPVQIPAIDTNRAVGIDPNDPEMAQIVVNPADPDADYALIGPDGQVINYPGSSNGWMTPVGNAPATVTFNNLIPGETYTVVARKKGNPSETPLGNLDAGVPVVANPGDMVEAPKYIIETKTNGIGTNLAVVSMVNGQTVNTAVYEDAKRGESFTLHAEPTDANGNAFLYWQIMNGRIPGVTGRQTVADFSGTMTNSNVVFRAIYDVRPTNSAGDNIAPVEQATRGGSEGEFGIDPSTILDLERTLSNPTDVSLINVNGADVRYNVIFNKRNPKGNETTIVKTSSSLDEDHPNAFTAAWALDIKEERYVDGRLVQNATPSNATVRAVVQFDAQDTDMLDYEIWDLGPHVGAPGWTPMAPISPANLVTLITRSVPLDANAGLVEFDANLNHTYVLVYSKTFKLSFIDNNQSQNHLHFDDVSKNFFKKIKVRKGDNMHDPEVSGDYMFDYIELKDYADGPNAGTLITPFDDVMGVQFDYVNWSKKNMPQAISVFDPSAPVNRSQVIYAYYNNNRPQVEQARTDLTNLIPEARNLQINPYLRTGEVQRLEEAIKSAMNVLERRRGRLENGVDPLRMANYPELQAEINALRALMDEMYRIIDANSSRIHSRTGGTGGGGGKGVGTALRPLQVIPEETFMLGVDGNWAINRYTGRWSFELYGGYPLNNRWGKIEHTESDGRTLTEWYRFDDQASLVYGWYKDVKLNKWYYLNESEGKDLGKMITGWHRDAKDKNWYYLDPVTGEMYIGWHQIGQHWYYFNIHVAKPTYDFLGGRWQFNQNNNNLPYGALYISTTTPDGYKVNHDGEWVE